MTLNKENYNTWEMQMKALLIKNEWMYANSKHKKPIVEDNSEQERSANVGQKR